MRVAVLIVGETERLALGIPWARFPGDGATEFWRGRREY